MGVLSEALIPKSRVHMGMHTEQPFTQSSISSLRSAQKSEITSPRVQSLTQPASTKIGATTQTQPNSLRCDDPNTIRSFHQCVSQSRSCREGNIKALIVSITDEQPLLQDTYTWALAEQCACDRTSYFQVSRYWHKPCNKKEIGKGGSWSMLDYTCNINNCIIYSGTISHVIVDVTYLRLDSQDNFWHFFDAT